MNILLITPYNFFEVKRNSSGNSMRIQALLDSFSQNGCKVTFFMYGMPWENKTRLGRGIKAHYFSMRLELIALAFLARKLFRTTAYDLILSKCSPIYFFQRRLKKIISQGNFDVIQCENISTVPLKRRFSDNIPVIVTAHDVMTKRCEQRYIWANANKPLARYCLKEMKRLEIEKLKATRFQICVSEADKKTFVTMGMDPSIMAVIPNGVDTREVFPMKKDLSLIERLGIDSKSPVLMFSGSDMFHNVQAAEHIIRTILPGVIKTFPHVKMLFVGSVSNEIKMNNLHLLFPENIVLCDYVPAINKFYSIADIYLLPAVYGTGSSLKAIEALAAGKPLISTSVGVRGFNLTPGKHYILEENRDRFAQRITELLENRDMVKSLAAGAREIALEYDWSFLMKRYLKIYNAVLKREKVTEEILSN